jgi:hypothetical protein
VKHQIKIEVQSPNGSLNAKISSTNQRNESDDDAQDNKQNMLSNSSSSSNSTTTLHIESDNGNLFKYF